MLGSMGPERHQCQTTSPRDDSLHPVNVAAPCPASTGCVELRRSPAQAKVKVKTHQIHKASPAIWNHTVLPATRHRRMHPALTPAKPAGTRFTYPGRMKSQVDLGVGYIPRWFTCPQTVTHPSSNHLIVNRLGVVESRLCFLQHASF